MDWLRIAAPFFGQLFQERGDELQKARERTIGLAEDRYKRFADNRDRAGQLTLAQILKNQSPEAQQDIATNKAQELEAGARTRKVGVETAGSQAELDAYNALTSEEKRRLQIAPAIQNEAYAKQVSLQEREKNKTPSQVHLENEQRWIDLITGPEFVANPNYEAAYQAALTLGLDDQPKSVGYSARFAGWFKGPYARRDAAKVKDGEGMEGIGGDPSLKDFTVSRSRQSAYVDAEPVQVGTPPAGAGVETAVAQPAAGGVPGQREQAIQALMKKKNPATGMAFTRQEAEAQADSFLTR